MKRKQQYILLVLCNENGPTKIIFSHVRMFPTVTKVPSPGPAMYVTWDVVPDQSWY